MALTIKRPNGTEDVTPKNIHKWLTVERIVKETASGYGFKEIRIPTFENTELFQRNVLGNSKGNKIYTSSGGNSRYNPLHDAKRSFE